jgi:hypothetical protein
MSSLGNKADSLGFGNIIFFSPFRGKIVNFCKAIHSYLEIPWKEGFLKNY